MTPNRLPGKDMLPVLDRLIKRVEILDDFLRVIGS
jgi:hypothetical protein